MLLVVTVVLAGVPGLAAAETRSGGSVVELLVLLLGLGALALVAYRAYRGRSDERASEPPVADDAGRHTV